MTEDQLRAEGWRPLNRDGFSSLAGPFWIRWTPDDQRIGFTAEPQHVNGHMGTVHGGVIMTFADVSMGCAAVNVLGGANCVTAQIQVQMVAAGKVGDFITCVPEVVRKTSSLIFLRGLITVGERTIASVDGIWKVVEKRPQANS